MLVLGCASGLVLALALVGAKILQKMEQIRHLDVLIVAVVNAHIALHHVVDARAAVAVCLVIKSVLLVAMIVLLGLLMIALQVVRENVNLGAKAAAITLVEKNVIIHVMLRVVGRGVAVIAQIIAQVVALADVIVVAIQQLTVLLAGSDVLGVHLNV